MDKIIITIAGVLGAGFVAWFFFAKKDNAVAAEGEIDIEVKGGYSPDVISIPAGKPMKFNFTRKDESTCLEEVVISDFKVRKLLPMNEKTTIEITPEKPGEYKFSCGMGMFHGKIIVK